MACVENWRSDARPRQRPQRVTTCYARSRRVELHAADAPGKIAASASYASSSISIILAGARESSESSWDAHQTQRAGRHPVTKWPPGAIATP
jgi:hypothetical protein